MVEMDFKDRLRAMRKRLKLKQEDLSDALNISVDTVRRWESGAHEPKLSDVVNLASVFNVTVGVLIGEEPMPKEVLQPIIQPQARRKREFDKITVQIGSLKVEVPATPEGYAFVERKLGDFKLEDVPQQEFVNSLKME